MNQDTQPGRIRRTEAGWQGTLERVLRHPVPAVWKMLTDPDAMAQWLASGTIEQKPGGRVRIDFADSGIVIDSLLTGFEEQRLLEYSWSSGDEPRRPLRWRLQPEADATRLTLTVQVPQSGDIAKSCAGFDAHLEMLAAALEGVSVRFPFELYVQMRKIYEEIRRQPG